MKRTKDYYFQLEELPIPLAFSNEEMNRNILDFSEENYHQERKPFMEQIGYYDDGHASEAIVDYIIKNQ